MRLETPEGWMSCQIGEVTQVVSGGTPRAKDPTNFTTDEGGISWITPADLSGYTNIFIARGARNLSEKGFSSCSATKIPEGSVLFSSRAPIGYVAIASNELTTNQGFKSFVLPDGLDSRFIYFYLKYIKPIAEDMATGTTFKELSGAVTAKLPLLIAPTNEQKRIADKLENLLSRVDKCREQLGRVESILKRLRQSVLALSTSGKLTQDWRKARTTGEDEDIGEGIIPASWEWKSMSELGSIQLGRQRAPRYHSGPNMRPYLRVQNIFEDRIDLSDVMEMDFPPNDFEKYQLTYGDILLNEGQSPELLGRPAMYRDELPGACFTNTLIRFQAFDIVNRDFALLVFRHYMHSGRFMREGKITTNIAHLSAGRFSKIEFPLPPLEEQQEIVDRSNQLFAFADRLESKYQSAVKKLDAISPAVLDKAFRGELVEQNSTEESAVVLLERIQAEKAAKPRKKTSKRKPKMPKTTKKYIKEIIGQLPEDTFLFNELQEKLSGEYDVLKDIIFALLDESKPSISQVFDQETKLMQFVRRDK